MPRHFCMKDLELFDSLDKAEKQQIAFLARKMTCSKGNIIFAQGDVAENIYLIQYGMLELVKTTEDGKEIVLDILKPGDILGENTLFDDTTYDFYARALTDCFICVCGIREFLELLSNSTISLKIIKSLSNKLNNFMQFSLTNAFIDAKNRVLNTLKSLSKSYGKPTERGVMLDFYISHEALSHLTNVSRVTVTNSITQLKDEGYIEIVQKKFIICEL